MTHVFPFYGHSAGLKGNFMSNFYPANYTVPLAEFARLVNVTTETIDLLKECVGENLQFNWSEQGFMLMKCLVFFDHDVDANMKLFKQILSVKSPATAKSLGRKVMGYDDKVWGKCRQDAMYWNLMWKFSQNDVLAQKLKDTGTMILVEATTNDRIWGIGLNVNDPKVHDQSQWRGQNYSVKF